MTRPAFVFDDVRVTPDRQIGRHSHHTWELACVLCGSGTRTVGDISAPIDPGEVILIPPDIPHKWQFDPSHTDADGCIANICVFFEPHIIDALDDTFPEMKSALTSIKSFTHALSYTGDARREILTLMMSMRGLDSAHRLPKMIALILLLSDTAQCRAAGSVGAMSRAERRMERIRVYCACNYGRSVTLDEVARHVGMNKSALCTFMRRHTGMSLSQYLNNMRLDRAREKLTHTDGTIAEIAMDCGFQNVTYFNRLFRARYGTTPKSVRAMGMK